MRDWNRIYVEAMVTMGNFHGSKSDVNAMNAKGYGFNSTPQLQARIQGHAQWIQQFLDAGWDGYLFSVMFNNLPGKRDASIIQMHQEVTKLYDRLAKRMVRKWRSPRWLGTSRLLSLVPICRCPSPAMVKKAPSQMYQ